ncbi:hypothetical protein A3H22_01810 [Candidatus Peribacteria bacterium RIFCSPLOWO2_12_FULL_55_15]|nr:MAG: hypothetical protein A2789_03280 [Candidatus Peribacteria bacterium RIFCSPHIGHO2_01_FULL_54_22]OGJ63403.1 MAG: hypothetical protein A3D12_04110 [Candidatus Peribacteria bacterium RIFCSPHIGHO2_02_FULL_55_24]OGJ64442.1 MAG: hypothetical protein A3E47_00885 [Candidatus Peribacteria bacterium RIFCSPHIGHO2_12_FULL_54_10]OGJ67883.1 MAG: hypothetical protein A2947_03525 [Candidatus Peribacteria bacterium RIFCSPLOWO2_01_FULL_54_110]OGJ70456.1 MAG: hypothetical protein A3H90_04195 [Candidatus Pe
MPQESPPTCTATLRITGMHCQSCELLLERVLKKIPGILAADVNHRTGMATITANTKNLPPESAIEHAVEKAGYRLSTEGERRPCGETPQEKWLHIAASLIIIFALYKIVRTFDLASIAPATSDAVSLGGVLLIGLVAGTSSCLAVTGGLLLSVAAKYNETVRERTAWGKLLPMLHFNIGRLASYFILGGLVGLLGQTITISTRITGYLNIAVAIVMLWLALQMLHIIPKGSCPLRPPKALARWIAGLSESKNPLAPLALGALTFFLPCGFTQSLQLVALASGSFLQGALTMFTFALGTLPSLVGISMLSATAKGRFQILFLRFAGTLVFVLALLNISSGLTLTGFTLPRLASFGGTTAAAELPAIVNGFQEITMRIGPGYYEPNRLTVKAGIPVRWTIDGTQASGCTNVLVVPSLNITQVMKTGPNVVTFTPPNAGSLAFSCSMGMVSGTITVI